MSVAPASNRASTAAAERSAAAWVAAQSGLPQPVTKPWTSNRSLAAKVSPSSGPPGRPDKRKSTPGTKAPRGSVIASLSEVRGGRKARESARRPSASLFVKLAEVRMDVEPIFKAVYILLHRVVGDPGIERNARQIGHHDIGHLPEALFVHGRVTSE